MKCANPITLNLEVGDIITSKKGFKMTSFFTGESYLVLEAKVIQGGFIALKKFPFPHRKGR